jgi:hypothetical protein
LCSSEVALSQEAVERLLGRLITDRQFRGLASGALDAACMREGFRLSTAELRLVSTLPFRRLEELAALLDPGLCRAGAAQAEAPSDPPNP